MEPHVTDKDLAGRSTPGIKLPLREKFNWDKVLELCSGKIIFPGKS